MFTVNALRPGDYLAVAVPAVTNNQWYDPAYLESLREHAKRISRKEGDAKHVDLTVKPSESP